MFEINIKATPLKDYKKILISLPKGKAFRFYQYEFPKEYTIEQAVLEALAREFGYEPSLLFNFEEADDEKSRKN